VLDGDPAPYPYAIGPLSVLSVTLVYCGQTVGRIKMKLGMQVDLGPGHIVLYGDPAPPPHLYCSQTAGCIKMPHGTEVGLGLRDIVFDVDPATPRKKADPSHPIFGPCLLWPNGWMDGDAAWYGNRPRPRPHCIRWGPTSRERGTSQSCMYCAKGNFPHVQYAFYLHALDAWRAVKCGIASVT